MTVALGTPREYPARPIVGVGGVVIRDGQVLLIRRRFEPLKGRWSVPGGVVDVGETLVEAVAREVLEETGLAIEVGPVLDVFERITRDDDQRVRYHYVLVDYLCRAPGGTGRAGSDADAVVWAALDDLGPYALTDKTVDVIARARDLLGGAPSWTRS